MERIRLLAAALLALICVSLSASAGSGLTWTWRNPLPSAAALKVMAFGGGTYVTAGQDGALYSSPDGVTWTPATNPAIGVGGQYLDAIYAGGKFVLAGVDTAGAGHVSTSSDGSHWIDTRLSFDPIESFGFGLPSLQLAFGNGTYVVMGPGGEATSQDAATWSEHSAQIPNAISFNPVVFANGVFIKDGFANPVVTYNTTIFFSSDGVNWNQVAPAVDGVLATNGTTFFAFGYQVVYTSTDGEHWTQHTMTGNAPYREEQVLWDGTQFLAISPTGFGSPIAEEASYSSPDGIAWTQLSSTQSAVPIAAGQHVIAATGAGYVAVGSGALNMQQSSDFFHWNTVFSGSNGPDPDLARVIYAGGRFVAVGETPQNGPAIMQSQDGSNWTQPPLPGGASGGLSTVAYGNGIYVAAGAAGWFSSPDASNWTPIAAPPSDLRGPITYGNGRFLVFTSPCSGTSCTTATSTDGKTWEDHPVTASHSAVAFDGTRFVSLGNATGKATDAPVYTSCDGVDWVHSADIDVAAGSTFSSLRQVANGLVATGDLACQSSNPYACLGPDQVAIATGPDSSHLTAVASSLTTDYPPTDVIFAGGLYYAAAHGAIYISSDGSNWTDPVGTPVDSNFSAFLDDNIQLISAFATNGTQLIAVGNSGSIVGAPVSTSPLSSGGACSALPEARSSSKGSFDLLTLAGLLSLLLLRRRVAI